jgi:hypothetical protein
MAARLAAVLPRFVALTLFFLLATATLTFAAQRSMVSTPPVKKAPAPKPEVLVVPDVRGQAYVFAKGILEDGGFAWLVSGKVGGYAANTVADQRPMPGTRVLDTGAPTIVLELRRNPGYAQEGTPENAAPFIGSPLRLAYAPKRKAAPRKAAPKQPAPRKAAPRKAAPSQAAPKRSARPPAFTVAGAPKEPLDEISLPARAKRLDAWLSTHRRPTSANVRAYLYQHAWIVSGAKLGWWRGAQALRILVAVDRRAQRLWAIGGKSERVAQLALRRVVARSR